MHISCSTGWWWRRVGPLASLTIMRVVIVGAGIVGTAVAALRAPKDEVLVLDQGGPELAGSTGHAPGFIGEYGGDPVATELAVATTRALERLADGDPALFDRVGCLEIATGPDGVPALEERLAGAREQGLDAELLTATQAAARAPELVDPARTAAALFFGRDAVADARGLTARLRTRAETAGAEFVFDTPVTSIELADDGVRLGTPGGPVAADRVVFCTGVWTAALTDLLGLRCPVVPVRHPYAWGARVPAPAVTEPFVRFPEQHVYARWHGERWGFGSYGHPPETVEMGTRDRADLSWDGRFDPVLAEARALMARPDLLTPERRLDGVFAVTPDNLPLVGRFTDRIAVAAAVWVTHSVGAAQALDRVLDDRATDSDRRLDPLRFATGDPQLLHRQAIAHYNDIYTRG